MSGESMELSTHAASAASNAGDMITLFGVPVITGAAATALGFMFMWPRNTKEAAIRIGSTIIFSTFFGPALVIALRSAWPGLFIAARDAASLYGADPAQGFLFIAAPLMVAAGLPAWWVVGAFVRWFDKRKDKDIGELVADARGVISKARGQE